VNVIARPASRSGPQEQIQQKFRCPIDHINEPISRAPGGKRSAAFFPNLPLNL
jgi:hypothetical protein